MFHINYDNLPRKRAKKEKKAIQSGILDATETAAENMATSADMLDMMMALSERVATLESASTTK